MSTVKMAAKMPATSERAEDGRMPNRTKERKPMKVLAKRRSATAVLWGGRAGTRGRGEAQNEKPA